MSIHINNPSLISNFSENSNNNNNKQINPDLIKIYLKVKEPLNDDKPYYNINLENNIFTLYDPVIKSPSEKSAIFEFDKIFTQNNENSYIYEEICRDSVNNALNGENITFISYGDTSSDKINVIYGNYEDSYTNINNRGIFPRFLEQLLNNINDNEEYKNNYSVNLSYMLINNVKVVDLSNYMGKEISHLKEEQIFNNGIYINKNNKDMLSSIKKVPTENVSDVVFFINKIFTLLEKLNDNSNYHLLSWSHFSFLIYITDNNGKNISNINFICLNGSEQLHLTKNNDSAITYSESKKKELIKLTKSTVDTQFTYDSIINSISNNGYINNIEIPENEVEDDTTLSKLTILLNHVSFGNKVKNIKFRIIGSICPNTGFYNNVRDTLMFLFENKQILRKKNFLNITTKSNNNNNNNNKDNEKDQKQNEIEIDHRKDDQIFELENKIKSQQKKISDLNDKINNKNQKILMLEKNYKKQVDVLKNYLNFNGDVNILLSGNEYTKEAKLARSIRDAKDNLVYYKEKNVELEKQLKEAKEIIKKLKTQKEIKETDKTMLTYYSNLKNNKEAYEKEIKLKNQFSAEINKLQDMCENQKKIINELNKEIENKNKIIIGLPELMQKNSNENLNINNIKEDVKKKIENHFKKEILGIEKNNLNEIKILKEKYENLLKQKDLIIKENNNEINKINKNYENEVKNYQEEIIKLDEILMQIINGYKILFKTQKIKDIVGYINSTNEFDIIINENEKKINNFSFPLLYHSLLKYNKLDTNNQTMIKQKRRPQSSYQIRSKNTNSNNNSNNTNLMKNNISSKNLSSQNKLDVNPDDIINKYNKITNQNEKLLKKEDLEIMSKEDIVKHCLDLNTKYYEFKDYIEKYAEFKKGFDVKEFKLTEDYVNNLYKKIERLNEHITEQIELNTKNKVIISSQKRSIDKLTSENILLRNQLEGKMIKDKLSYPILNSKDNYYYNNTSKENFKNKSTNNFLYINTGENNKSNNNNNNMIKILPNTNISNNYLNSNSNEKKITSYTNQITNSNLSSTNNNNVFRKSKTSRPLSSSNRSHKKI